MDKRSIKPQVVLVSINVAISRREKNWLAYKQTYLNPEEKQLVQEVENLLEYANRIIQELQGQQIALIVKKQAGAIQ